MSKRLGFAIELPPPWHLAICGTTDPGAQLPFGVESFTNVGPMEEFIGDTGSPNPRVDVISEQNPQRLTPTQFARTRSGSAPLKEITFAGRPAVEMSGFDGLSIFVAEGDRMYTVGYRVPFQGDATTMDRIARSFRFLSATERQALPDPTPMVRAAAPTVPALAAALKAALEGKDVAAAERLLSPCVSQGVQQGGGSAMTREKFIADLRAQFQRGLTVSVDTGSIRTDAMGSGDSFVRSRWSLPTPSGMGTPPPSGAQNIDLMIGQTSGGYYWRGTLLLPPS